MHRTPPLPPPPPLSKHTFIAWKSYCTFWNEVRKTNRLGGDGMAQKKLRRQKVDGKENTF